MAARRKAVGKRAKAKGGKSKDLIKRPRRPAGAKTRRAGTLRAGRAISARLKAIAIAAEPPRDADPANLAKAFRDKLQAALAKLAAELTPFKLVEGFRTTDRQQWLYGSGRPNAVPYGRPGPILTNADGVNKKSKHQGSGAPGTGAAADCYPLRNGSVYIPPSTDPVWRKYADAVVAEGLLAGHDFTTIKDSPHSELP